MGQIVRKKKKGRPSKADLAARLNAAGGDEEKELRRSGRRRNVRYTFDIDDFLDEEYFLEDEEDERRREKKLELLLKLQGKDNDGEDELTPSRTRRVSHAPAASASSSDYDDDGKPSKKRKIHGDDEEFEENDDDNENDDEVRGRKAESRGVESSPGTPLERPSGVALPDKKTLELILDKLQKKDIYGVYAEPVDPEELPDYHDVIKHPMDFATVRNKLRNGSYARLELFESDVLLICSNAMQYNAPDTIYYKQARSIQELATKKFQKLRSRAEHTEKEVKSDQKPKSSAVVKKLIKKPIGRMQEPVGSDFSSGATLANAGGGIQSGSNACPGTSGRPGSIDWPIEGNSFLTDNLDKEELHSGKGPICRFGRKSALQDENRRATFTVSSQSASSSDSVFSTFEGERKDLIPVGLYADHSYARSLARFAATLGPIAWEFASRRIEQALPPAFKFGRGWIGEYEPLPTPVLMLKNYTLKEPSFLAKFRQKIDVHKEDKMEPKKNLVSVKDNPVARPTIEGKQHYVVGSAGSKPTANNTNISNTAKEQQHNGDANIESKPFFLCASGNKPPNSASPKYHAQNFHSQNFIESEKKHLKQDEINAQPLATNQSSAEQSKVTSSIVVPSPRSVKMAPNNRNPLSSVCSEQLNINGFSAGGLPNAMGLSNGNGAARGFANNGNKAATLFPHGQEQGLGNPIHMMRMLEKSQNQQHKSSQQSRVDSSPVSPATPTRRGDDSNNAAAAAARAWMSIGAGGFKQASDNTGTNNSQISAESLYNSSRDHQPQNLQYRGEFPASGMHFQPGKGSFPFNAFVPPHMSRAGIEAQIPNRPMVFPQLVAADLSRFQVPSPRHNLNTPAQPRPKQESLPPDLNISFQSSGSPGRPSSGVLVDSQQPDLALQL
ncbi:bromodomain-containing protein 9 [Ipomoea triloba]|uniref:bromodomain-containing protein 9 n=1 Tax=Ipomoea triloba TaxID=35885 RepID=UPI00125D50ED|nr:bromodomain-containing protein 9 [Ipomoea triloba]